MELSPVLIVFVVVMLLSGLRAVFEFLGKIAVEAEQQARRQQEAAKQRQAQQRAGMPGSSQPTAAATPTQVEAPRPAPPPPPQPILLEEILRGMLGEPPRQAPPPPPRPKPVPPPPKPRPRPAPVLVEPDRVGIDLDHIKGNLTEQEHRIDRRLTTNVDDRVLHSSLDLDDRLDLHDTRGKRRVDVFAELEQRASPMQRAFVYAALLGKTRAHTGPMHRPPMRKV